MISRRGLHRSLKRIQIHRKLKKSSFDGLEDEIAEEVLEAMLYLMNRKLSKDPDYRRNIEGFQGTYFFKTEDLGATVLVEFKNGQMRETENVTEEDSAKADIVVTFKNGKAFMEFLFAPLKGILKDSFDEEIGVDRPHTFDVMENIRKNEVNVTGNLNYFYKFGFMANHFLLDIQKKIGLPK
jgi:hypothetical protein